MHFPSCARSDSQPQVRPFQVRINRWPIQYVGQDRRDVRITLWWRQSLATGNSQAPSARSQGGAQVAHGELLLEL